MEVGIFIPCFIDQLFPETGMSMVAVLKHAGVKALYNPEQTCCGQVAFNTGFHDEAKHVAEKFIQDFAQYKYVVGPSASCIGMVKNYYPQMFDNSALHNENKYLGRKIYEFTDFLVNVAKMENLGGRFEARITFHDSCAALREYGLKDEPRRLLAQIEGLELMEMKDREVCCGFGGTFAVKHEAISTAMAEQKVKNALETGAQYIVSTEASCLMQLDGYIKKHKLPIETLHIAELLARSISGK
ncbi:MAG: (Fe-S)-binding protein [Bacteroidales bacterium]|nr:(Fe-S)-binding protein [Bacteroidales bacterium]